MNVPLIELDKINPTIVFDIKYASDDNFIAAQVDGYQAPRALLIENAAMALGEVQNNLLKMGLTLKVYDAYRPQRAVDHFIRWSQDPDDQTNKNTYFPNIDKSELFSAGYLVKRSGHSRGSTVDLTIAEMGENNSHEDLEMGTPFDFFDPKSWSNASNISEKAKKNRQLLRDEMGKMGFQPFATEWWHFTLKNEMFPDSYFDIPIT